MHAKQCCRLVSRDLHFFSPIRLLFSLDLTIFFIPLSSWISMLDYQTFTYYVYDLVYATLFSFLD